MHLKCAPGLSDERFSLLLMQEVCDTLAKFTEVERWEISLDFRILSLHLNNFCDF